MRAVINADIPGIMSALVKMLSYSKAPHMQFVDKMEAELFIYNVVHENGHTTEITDHCRAVIADGFFIMFQVAPMWCTKENFLMEEMVIRISGDAPPDVVPEILLKLQKRFNCVASFGGDSQGDYMGRYYRAAGWRHSGTLYIGGDDGMGSQGNWSEGCS